MDKTVNTLTNNDSNTTVNTGYSEVFTNINIVNSYKIVCEVNIVSSMYEETAVELG